MNKPDSQYLTPSEKRDIALQTAFDIFAAIGVVLTVIFLLGYFYGK